MGAAVVLLPDTAAPRREWAPGAGSYNRRAMTKGVRDRFESFVRTSRHAMLRIARNICRSSGVDPEDLVEETLERTFQLLERGVGGDPPALKFVIRMMSNRFLDLLRRQRTHGGTPEQVADVEQEEVVVVEPEPVEQWRSVDGELSEAMAALEPERIREVYRMHVDGMRYRQIAQKLGIPEGTVGSDLSIARRQLRRRLGRTE
jgi:RNA polymerase sigma-70 factor, ECF subfamily